MGNDDKDFVVCKVQTDAGGTQVMIYSEDRETVFAVSHNPDMVKMVARALDIPTQMGKKYVRTKMHTDGRVEFDAVVGGQTW